MSLRETNGGEGRHYKRKWKTCANVTSIVTDAAQLPVSDRFPLTLPSSYPCLPQKIGY